jgi:hypothetical protein
MQMNHHIFVIAALLLTPLAALRAAEGTFNPNLA